MNDQDQRYALSSEIYKLCGDLIMASGRDNIYALPHELDRYQVTFNHFVLELQKHQREIIAYRQNHPSNNNYNNL